MAFSSDPGLLVLHGLRLKAVASSAVIAETIGLSVAEVDRLLTAFADRAWVRYREGALAGWSLTPAGRIEASRRVADEIAVSGASPVLEAAYDRFGALNPRLLQACTDWQLLPTPDGAAPVMNDHHDVDHDRSVLATLVSIDEQVQPICTDLAEALTRFGSYGPRLAGALARIRSGEADWFAKPVIDSYHSVWFELHEDVLASIGLRRSEERSA